MAKFLTFTYFFLSLFCVHAQSTSKSINFSNVTRDGHLMLDEESNLVVVGYSNVSHGLSSSGGHAFLTDVDFGSTQNHFDELSIPSPHARIFGSRFFILSDSSVVYLLGNGECDYFQKYTCYLFNKDGSIRWQSAYNFLPYDVYSVYLTEYNQLVIEFENNNSIAYLIDLNNGSVDKDFLTLAFPNHQVQLDSIQVNVYRDQVFIYNTNTWTSLAEVFIDYKVLVLEMTQNAIFVATDEHLLKYDFSWNLVDSVAHGFTKVQKMIMFDDKIYLGTPSSLHVFDFDFNVVEEYEFPNPYELFDMIQYENKFALSFNTCGDFSSRNCGIQVLETPKDPFVLDFGLDVALTQLEFLDQPVYAPIDQQYGSNAYSIEFGNIFATVKNNSTDTVQEFSIRGNIPQCSFLCGISKEWNQKYSIQLAPGDSTYVFLGEFSAPCIFNPNPIFCASVYAPNGKTDPNLADNYLCEISQTILPTTDLKQETIGIYPNPVSDFIYVKMPEEMQFDSYNILIINALGKKVVEREKAFLQDGFDVQDLPKGYYTLVISELGFQGSFVK